MAKKRKNHRHLQHTDAVPWHWPRSKDPIRRLLLQIARDHQDWDCWQIRREARRYLQMSAAYNELIDRLEVMVSLLHPTWNSKRVRREAIEYLMRVEADPEYHKAQAEAFRAEYIRKSGIDPEVFDADVAALKAVMFPESGDGSPSDS